MIGLLNKEIDKYLTSSIWYQYILCSTMQFFFSSLAIKCDRKTTKPKRGKNHWKAVLLLKRPVLKHELKCIVHMSHAYRSGFNFIAYGFGEEDFFIPFFPFLFGYNTQLLLKLWHIDSCQTFVPIINVEFVYFFSPSSSSSSWSHLRLFSGSFFLRFVQCSVHFLFPCVRTVLFLFVRSLSTKYLFFVDHFRCLRLFFTYYSIFKCDACFTAYLLRIRSNKFDLMHLRSLNKRS